MHPITAAMLKAQEDRIMGRPIKLPVEIIIWKMANAEECRIYKVLRKAKREAMPGPAPKATTPKPGVAAPAPANDVTLAPEPTIETDSRAEPVPEASPRRDVGPIPKIKGRTCMTKDQRETIVGRLHGIRPEDATEITIQLTDTPGESTITFRKPQQAHNLYYYLTGEKLFEEYTPYKPGRNGRGNGHKADYDEIIPAEADKAMRLYGHPAHAAALLKHQAETYEANDVKLHRLFHSVVSELESRAQDKTWYSWRGRRDEAEWFRLESRLEAIGQPLAAAGRIAIA